MRGELLARGVLIVPLPIFSASGGPSSNNGSVALQSVDAASPDDDVLRCAQYISTSSLATVDSNGPSS